MYVQEIRKCFTILQPDWEESSSTGVSTRHVFKGIWSSFLCELISAALIFASAL